MIGHRITTKGRAQGRGVRINGLMANMAASNFKPDTT